LTVICTGLLRRVSLSTTVCHVNQHVIKRNRKTGDREPPLTIKRKSGGPVARAHRAAIVDKFGSIVAEIVYQPEKPLKCGAVCWVETDLKIVPLFDQAMLSSA
jgi:hypothetical protein